MAEQGRGPAELQRAFNDLAGLLEKPDARGQLKKDPKAFLESKGITGVPDEAAEALSELSPPEMELFARVQRKLGDAPLRIPGGEEVGIIF